jgi:hypothetical protein
MEDKDLAEYLSSHVGTQYSLKDANCWHLATKILRECYGTELPQFSRRDALSRTSRVKAANCFAGWANWQEVKGPIDGALTLLGRLGCDLDIHVGVWIERKDFRGCLHTNDPHGVVFDDPFRVAQRGYDHLRFVVKK